MSDARRVLAEGTDAALRDGAALLDRAAALGSGEAHARLAGFLAAGVREPADWDRSVAMLEHAADQGYAPARDELRILAERDAPSPAALRALVDIRALVQPRPGAVMRPSPRIRVFKALFSNDECNWIIARARHRLGRASVYGNQTRESLIVNERTNREANFGPADLDVALTFLRARLAHSVRAPLHHFEPATVLHYEVGQHFAPHFDFLDPAIPGHVADLARRGQRVATALVYLNDDYDGGETDFPTLGWSFKGGPGDALVFDNVGPTGAPDRQTLHAGRPPTRGEKWLLSQWVRDRAPG
ncbi:MAG: 2OG-Fe(II) oxygenase [Alphaproteobacteria bacterium]|nr:2OG-Fe(II) oxygenase [Alphaproteobacteria bacterium]